MGPVSVLYTAFASIALFTCFLQLFLALKKKSDILTLISSVLSFLVFLRYSLVVLCSAPLGIADDHLTLLRCQLILTQAITICTIGLIFHILKDTRKLFIFIQVLLIGLLMILCLILPDYLLFGSHEVIHFHDLSSGINDPLISKGFTWWRGIADITVLLFTFSNIMLLAKKIKTNQYKKIIVFYIGTGLILFASIYDQLVDLGLLKSIYILPFAIFLYYMVLNFVPFLYLLEEVAENNMISQQEKKWKNFVYQADVIVVGLNRMGHVEFINPFFLKLAGYREDEVIDRDWFEFFIPPKDAMNVQGAFIEALASDFHPYYENPILTKSKEEIMIRWFNVRTRDQNSNITGSLSIGVDMTEDLHEKIDLINKLKAAQNLINKLKKD
jgi:PAS domain S-box-containing protein